MFKLFLMVLIYIRDFVLLLNGMLLKSVLAHGHIIRRFYANA